jgi:hypothetical protein
MKYDINKFEDFLSVFQKMENLTPDECINELSKHYFGTTFEYYLPGVSKYLIENEINKISNGELLFYGTGNGIWIKNLNINNSFSIVSETEELSAFVKHIMPNTEIKDDKNNLKYDLVVVANSDFDILDIIKEKLKPKGRLIFVASEEFILGKKKNNIRRTIKNYFSINSIYELGISYLPLGNRLILPYENVRQFGTFYLTVIDNKLDSKSDVKFYFNNYSKVYGEEVEINNELFKTYNVNYNHIEDRWDYEFNSLDKCKKRIEINKRGGIRFGLLCENILEGINFYYESNFISSVFNGHKILDEFKLKELIKNKSNINKVKTSDKGISKNKLFDNLQNIPASLPKTKDLWKTEQLIINENDIIINRRTPIFCMQSDNKIAKKYIASDELIIIRGENNEIIKRFIESEEFIEQLDANTINGLIEKIDLINLLIPDNFLTSYNSV